MSFSSDIAKITAKYKKRLQLTAENATYLLFYSVVMDTPVDTGLLRGNWQATVDAPAVGTVNMLSPTGMEVLDEIKKNVKFGHVNYLTNNLEYGPILEYGLYPNPPKRYTGKTLEGFSIQAPFGFVRVNAARWNFYVETALSKSV